MQNEDYTNRMLLTEYVLICLTSRPLSIILMFWAKKQTNTDVVFSI